MRTVLVWMARLGSLAAIVPLMLILFGENGTGPEGWRAWTYLALFPIGFSASYVLAWRYPLLGGISSLVCLAASLIVIGKLLPLAPYLVWGILAIPGLLFVIAGVIGHRADRQKSFSPQPN